MELFSLGGVLSAPPTKFVSPVGLVKWQKDDDNAAHVRNGMVPGRSPDRRFAHCVQSWCDARPASPRMMIIWTLWYTSSCFEGKENSKNDGDTYISHSMQHLPRFLRKFYILLSFLQIASKQLPGIDTWYKQFNCPTTHPVCRAPPPRET